MFLKPLAAALLLLARAAGVSNTATAQTHAQTHARTTV